MAEQTEAACLLASGTAYRKRILLHPTAGGDVFVGVRPGGFSLYEGDEPIHHFDFEGRWQRTFIEGTHYLKGLDTAVRSIDRVRESDGLILRRRTLTDVDSVHLDTRIRSGVIALLETIRIDRYAVSGQRHSATPLTVTDLRDLLARAAAWDASAWAAERDRYRATYGPLPFIPPACPNPLILQAGIGAGLGKSPPTGGYRSLAGFEEHAGSVGALLGRRLASCRDIFLDGLGMLDRPGGEIVEIVEAAVRHFPLSPPATRSQQIDENGHTLASIQAVLGDFSDDRPRPDFWARLKALGMRQITIGIESGDPAVRAVYGKSWGNAQVAPVVQDIREAGIACDAVVLVGAGGTSGATSHVEATLQLVGSLPASSVRRIYLVDARGLEGLTPFDSPLSDSLAAEQAVELKRRLGRCGPAVAIYNADKQAI